MPRGGLRPFPRPIIPSIQQHTTPSLPTLVASVIFLPGVPASAIFLPPPHSMPQARLLSIFLAATQGWAQGDVVSVGVLREGVDGVAFLN